MNIHSSILKETLLKISNTAYDFLEVFDTKENKIRQVHEDAISSILLKKIAKLSDQGIYVKTKSLDVLEGQTGIDFDIWIGEDDKNYIRFVVQAKNFGNQTSLDAKYIIKKEQCDKIITFAKKEHTAFPLYFLYQFIDDKSLKSKHFSFLEEFENSNSSITFTSAINIQKQIAENKLKFSDIHKNDFERTWKNDIYKLFEKEKENIALPLYLLYDISPSKIKKFQELISTKNNSLGFFFFFFFEGSPFEIHKITSKDIEEKYGKNTSERYCPVKNLIIINDNYKTIRDRTKTINKIMK
ncbi:hypothetical protein [Flavobacterium sp. FlaQc-47]|uniref:hypothetical protein n=1 Tax=Flavobacterium sp. FlaQc-47 TaxID=3374180 RepID=UPI0037572079